MKWSTIALIMFCFIMYAQNAVGSIVQTLIDAFPDISASAGRLVVTLPSLGSFFTALIAGLLAGDRIRFKTLFISTCVLWTIGGLMPVFFYNSFALLLLSRFIFGVGTGFALCSNAYIVAFYPPEQEGRMLGLAIALNNGGSILIQLMGGALAEISWVYPFYMYLICPVVLIFVVLFLKEPEKKVPQKKGQGEAGQLALSKKAVLFLLSVLCFGILFSPLNAGTSTLVADWSLGGSFVSGIVLAMVTVGGSVSGFVMNCAQKLKRFTIAAMLLLVAAGYLITLAGRSVPAMCIGGFLAGIGYYAVKPLFTIYLSHELTPRTVTLVTTLLYACSNLGIFFSNGWISLSDRFLSAAPTEMENAYIASMAAFVTAAIFYIIYNPMKTSQKRGDQ